MRLGFTVWALGFTVPGCRICGLGSGCAKPAARCSESSSLSAHTHLRTDFSWSWPGDEAAAEIDAT